MRKQLAFMLGRQQIFLELNEELEDYDDLIEIMSNTHLNNHFLSLAREVRFIDFTPTETLLNTHTVISLTLWSQKHLKTSINPTWITTRVLPLEVVK